VKAVAYGMATAALLAGMTDVVADDSVPKETYSIQRNRPDFPPGSERVPLRIDRIVVVNALERRDGAEAISPNDIAEATVALGRTVCCDGPDNACVKRIDPNGEMSVAAFLKNSAHTLRDLYLIRDAIARKVEDKGYFLATTIIPPQKLVLSQNPPQVAPRCGRAAPQWVTLPKWPETAPDEPKDGIVHLKPPDSEPWSSVAVNWEAALGTAPSAVEPPPNVAPVLIPPPGFGPRPVKRKKPPVRLHPVDDKPGILPKIAVNLEQAPGTMPHGVAWEAAPVGPPAGNELPTNTACIFIVKGKITGKVVGNPGEERGEDDIFAPPGWTAEQGFLRALKPQIDAGASITKDEFEDAVLRINDLPGIATEFVLTSAGKPIATSERLSGICAQAAVKDQATAVKVSSDQSVRVSTDLPDNDRTLLEERLNVTAVAEKHNFRVFSGIDNRNNGYVGRWAEEFGMEGNLPGLKGTILHGGRLEGRYKRSISGGRLASWDLVGDAWLGDVKMSLSHGHSHSSPGAELEPLEMDSITDTSAVYFSYAAIRRRENNVTLRVGGETVDTETNVIGNKLIEDRVRVGRIGATYDTVHFLNDVRLKELSRIISFLVPTSAVMADVEISQGLKVFNPTPNGYLYLSREDGRNDFTKFRTSFSTVSQTPFDRFSVYVAGNGQWSSVPLLVSEQFTIGGKDFGRAFNPAAFTGDHGISGLAEVRYSRTPDGDLRPFVGEVQLQPYTFIDGGRVWQKSVDTGIPNATAVSAGLGVRANVAVPKIPHIDRLALSFDVQGAAPVVNNAPNANGNGMRAFFLSSLRGEF